MSAAEEQNSPQIEEEELVVRTEAASDDDADADADADGDEDVEEEDENGSPG
jgi:hypothetical protein